MLVEVYSMIEANKLLASGQTYPMSICNLIDKYIQNVLISKFPLPVKLSKAILSIDELNYDLEQDYLVGECTKIDLVNLDTDASPKYKFKAKLDLNQDLLAEVLQDDEFKAHDWYLDLPIYGNINEVTYVVNQFSYMDAYVRLKNLYKYLKDWE